MSEFQFSTIVPGDLDRLEFTVTKHTLSGQPPFLSTAYVDPHDLNVYIALLQKQIDELKEEVKSTNEKMEELLKHAMYLSERHGEEKE